MSGPARKFGIAVIGLGRMGVIHARSILLSPRARLKWIVRHKVEEARSFADTFDSPIQCVGPGQLDSVLGDHSVDGVVICSPTSQHETVIRAAVDAGKAVFSEKPITPDVDSTRSCYEMAEAKGIPLLCAFHRRFDPSLMAVKASVETGQSGRLRLLRCSSHDHQPPTIDYIKHSGGILKDSTIHDLDMALWMTASPARRVYVQGRAFDPDVRSAGDLDLVVVSVEHESGSVSVIDNGRRCAHGYDQRLEAICEDGSYVVTNRATHQLYTHGTGGSTSPGIDAGFDTRYPQAYLNEMEHFLDILSGSATPKVTKQDTVSAMELAEAAATSALTGQVVNIGDV
ncbi:hypothetical protein RRG08_065358 [Elysia crispata]|uniref:Inositol 2-dehydrogenase n=1 Tax=Elysia crispata TaxID=231223 RepID=A0AAE1AGS3_9GAST|nr:hypothetical protein RRG08_065358 [Elysia crispata]